MTNQASSHDQPDKANKKTPAPASSEMVITPAGPVPKEQVQEVKPGEVVRRNKDGTLNKVPRVE